jgi:hypothetical protein
MMAFNSAKGAVLAKANPAQYPAPKFFLTHYKQVQAFHVMKHFKLKRLVLLKQRLHHKQVH